MFACQVNFCGLMICCMHIHNLVTSCVGVTELEEDPASKTKLNVLLGFRNTVLRKKQERLTEPAHHHLGWCWDDLPPFVSLLVCPALDPARRHLGRSGGGALSSVLLFHFHSTVGCSSSGRIGSSSSSPPFILALAWSPRSSLTPMTCSCSRSPPFRTVRERSTVI